MARESVFYDRVDNNGVPIISVRPEDLQEILEALTSPLAGEVRDRAVKTAERLIKEAEYIRQGYRKAREREAEKQRKREEAREREKRRREDGLPRAERVLYSLGLTLAATETDVKAAYHKCAKVHHSDVGGDEKMLRLLNEAYKEAMEFVGAR